MKNCESTDLGGCNRPGCEDSGQCLEQRAPVGAGIVYAVGWTIFVCLVFAVGLRACV